MCLKILHLIGQMERGGAERQLIYLTQALQERGWQQAVVTFNPGDAWDQRLAEIGIPLFGIPRHSNKLWRLWQLTLVQRRVRPELIHSWSHHTSVYASWLVSISKLHRIVSFRNIPTVDNYTGVSIDRVQNAGVYAKADCVISNSSAALQLARSAGVRMRRSEVINNIVVANRRANAGNDVRVPRIVAAGALTPLKAYDVLLRALGQIAASGRRFELLIAGDGPERSRLELLADQLGIRQQVSFLGAVDNVPELLASAHLLVHPSRSEGLSNTILEAMAEGLPVIATRVGGTPEIVSDGETGLLVSPDEPVLLASRIQQLLDNPLLRARLGSAGFKLVSGKFSAATVASDYERIYESVGAS